MLLKASDKALPIKEINWDKLRFPDYEMLSLANGATLFTMVSNKPGLVSFEMVFENGRIPEKTKLSSRVTANQILEGSHQVKASQVVDTLDYYGAHCGIHADLDFTVISLSCLQKHFQKLLAFVMDLVVQPAFRKEDLHKTKIFYTSQLQHQLTEPDYVSYREFTAQVYGPERVYGYNSSPELIEQLKTEDLREYHRLHYTSDRLKVFYCGDCAETVVHELKTNIMKVPLPQQVNLASYLCDSPFIGKKHFPIHNCAQTSLKIGCKAFKRDHPDFFGMYILNTILGDYFGSRLMKNIREEKGFTYDIHSTLDAQKYDGCFYISAELAPDQINNSIDLIFNELDDLKQTAMEEKELNLVRNYLCGHLMRLLDGPFQAIIFLKILATEYQGPNAFEDLLHQILSISPSKIKELAKTHLPDKEWTIITAGA